MAKCALVVGAAGGVGQEVVKLLLAAEYDVIGTVLNAAEAAQLREVGKLKDIIEVDLGNADNVATALNGRLHCLDAVVVCAAISPYGPVEITPLAKLRRTLEINTISAVAVYQVCMPLLRQSRGRIVFVSSFAGKIGLPAIGHYVASKFALEGLCDVMRREAKPWHVDIVVVEPGGIRTPMVTGQIAAMAGERAALSAEQEQLYGGLYATFEKLLGLAVNTGLEPIVVATKIVEVLQCADPQPRYQVGDDAQFLCNVVAKQGDAEQDATVAGFIAQAV